MTIVPTSLSSIPASVMQIRLLYAYGNANENRSFLHCGNELVPSLLRAFIVRRSWHCGVLCGTAIISCCELVGPLRSIWYCISCWHNWQRFVRTAPARFLCLIVNTARCPPLVSTVSFWRFRYGCPSRSSLSIHCAVGGVSRATLTSGTSLANVVWLIPRRSSASSSLV